MKNKFDDLVVFGSAVILLLLMGAVFNIVKAETIATMPNQADGKIVLTNETCEYAGKKYPKLNRAYNYGSTGNTSEGCYYIEDETVVTIWNNNGTSSTMRYPAGNFTIRKQSKNYM